MWHPETQIIHKDFPVRCIALKCESHSFSPSVKSPLRPPQSSEWSSLDGMKIISRTPLKALWLPRPFLCVHIGKKYLTFLLYNNFTISEKGCQRDFLKIYLTFYNSNLLVVMSLENLYFKPWSISSYSLFMNSTLLDLYSHIHTMVFQRLLGTITHPCRSSAEINMKIHLPSIKTVMKDLKKLFFENFTHIFNIIHPVPHSISLLQHFLGPQQHNPLLPACPFLKPSECN